VFKRLFWLSVGLVGGFGSSFWLMRTVRRTMERFTPQRLTRNAAAGARTVGTELKAARDEGRAAMRQREAELRAGVERRTR